MLKIHKKVEYALISLKYMSAKKEQDLVSAKEIAEHFQIPFDQTSRVLQLLAAKFWLRSEQGPQGGYILAKNLDDLSLQELIEIIEGPQGVVKCVSKNVKCPIAMKCNVVSPMTRLNESMQVFLQQLKVSELLSGVS